MQTVSIIVPVYNAEEFIEKCIVSLKRQTYKDISIILVDDGSSDGSGDICDRLSKEDSRIKVIHKENGGVSSARNVGLDAIEGEYITFVDADDYVSENYISSLYNGIKKDDADFYVGSYKEIGLTSEKQHIAESGTYCPADGVSYAKAISRADIMNTIVPKMFKTKLIADLRFDTDIKYAEDTFFVFSYLSRCDKISFGAEAEYFYNKKMTDNASQKLFEKRDEYVWRAFLVYKDAIEKINIVSDEKNYFVAKRSLEVFGNTVDYYARLRFGKYFTKDRFNDIYEKFSPFFNSELKSFDGVNKVLLSMDKDLIYNSLKLSLFEHLKLYIRTKARALYINFKKRENV